MFVLTTIVDTVHVPADMFYLPTLSAIHQKIDLKFPNRIIMDLGLVICRYGNCLKITNGSCVPGEGGSHHECLFRLVVFRPFVEEVCVGTVVRSTPEGVQVSLGFFQDIFIPAYWMLRPSRYEEKLGLWVWTPNYDDDGNDEEEGGGGEGEGEEGGVKTEGGESQEEGNEESEETNEPKKVKVKSEEPEVQEAAEDEQEQEKEKEKEKEEGGEGGGEGEGEGEGYAMHIGAEIRFKVKSIQFTQITNTAKGVQATTTTTSHSHTFPKEQQDQERTSDKPLRKRSTSVDLSDVYKLPASMHIVASICEDGLGLTSWWESGGDEEEEEEGEGEGGEEEGEGEGEEEAGEEGEGEGEYEEMNYEEVDYEDYGQEVD